MSHPQHFFTAAAAFFLLVPLMSYAQPNGAQTPHGDSPKWALPTSHEPTHGEWGDQGDGTYANPVMPGDFSDLDAIRVGDDYYAISSTFQMSPGLVILHSRDLVNWTLSGHAVSDVTAFGPRFDWDRMDGYSRGIWAGAIRHHAGRFYVYFNTPDEGFFMTSARTPTGPWDPVTCLWRTDGWDDPCPFWDDDGQAYLVASHFAAEPPDGKRYNIHLFKMSADGKTLDRGSDRIIHHSDGSEANKLFKINGLYYHFYSEVRRDEGRVVMMERSRDISGPYEIRQLNHVGNGDGEPNQGGLVQTPSGDWWFVTHQGKGMWAGRQGCLLPVTWIDGWPVLGSVGSDGIGGMVWRAKKPILGFPKTSLVFDDEFDTVRLDARWEWNFQPRRDRWSLTERPGFLRLHAFPSLRPDDIKAVGNILTQRSMSGARNEVTLRLDVSGMGEGQRAGLCHFGLTSSWVGVSQSGGIRTITASGHGQSTSGPALHQPSILLRSVWDTDGKSHYSYSLDGKTFTDFGAPYQLTWGNYRGDKTGLFTSSDTDAGGYVDVDWFHYEVR